MTDKAPRASNTWELPKIRGPFFWGPYNKDPTIWATILVSPIFGNSHIAPKSTWAVYTGNMCAVTVIGGCWVYFAVYTGNMCAVTVIGGCWVYFGGSKCLGLHWGCRKFVVVL